MNSELKIQIKRMQTILARQKRPIHRSKAAKSQTFDTMKAKTGIVLDKVTRDFFRFSNGSNGDLWAAVESDELQPLAFLALEEALSDWALFSPYDRSVYLEWNVKANKRDARIQPSYIRHKLWFPLASFNGGSTLLLYDADPTKHGRSGQIIVYQHDPDAIYYVAASFLEFLEKSNDLLAIHADELLPAPPEAEIEPEIWDICEVGDLRRLKRILANGTPLDIQRTMFSQSYSLLEHSAINGHLRVVTFLLGQGLPIGKSLIYAAEAGHLDVVKYLISQGGQIEVQTDYGDTALMRAARFGHTETVEFLVEKKATILTKNQEGKTAADIARENKHAGDPATTINALETAAGRGNLRDQNSRRKKLH